MVAVLAAVLAVAGGYWLIWVRPKRDRLPVAADPVLVAEAGPAVTAAHGPPGSCPAPSPDPAALGTAR